MKKIFSLILLLVLVLSCFVGCGKEITDTIPEGTIDESKVTEAPMETEAAGSLRWPKFGVCKFLPVPPSNEGYIHEDGSDEADIDVYEISQDDFYQYVAECQEMGFVIDYYSDETDYEAYNEEDYYLWLDYDQDTKVMNIWIYYDDERQESEENEMEGMTESPTEEATEAATEEITEAPTKETEKANGLRSEFKEAMDSYEAFMDEYVEFMKKYKKNPSDWSLLAEYAKFMADYAKFAEDFAKWNSEDMNDAELAYYLEVQARVTKKLTEIA